MQKIRRSYIVGLLAALAALLSVPTLLFAHARLVRSSPAANAHVVGAPAAVTLWFSEQPELAFTVITVADSAGVEHRVGKPAAVPGEQMVLSAAIDETLPPGTYTVTWRTAATDGHPSNGKFSFVVENPPTSNVGNGAASAITSSISSSSDSVRPPARANPIVEVQRVEANTFSSGVRWAGLVALLALIGAITVRLAVLPEAALPRGVEGEASLRLRGFGLSATLLFAFATFMRLSAESALLGPGSDASGGGMTAMVRVVRETGWGRAWLIGAGGMLAVAIGLFGTRLKGREFAGWLIAMVGVVAIAVSEVSTGHAGASPRFYALGVSLTVAHLLGAGGWLGGLAALLVATFPALKRLRDGERRSVGQRLVRAYHASAVQCVIVVVISALVVAWLRVGSFAALAGSRYGNILILKSALVLVVLAFGVYHWRAMVRRDWNEDTGFRFKRSAVLELLVGALVVAATSVLAATPLPRF